jgi:hypothetical protein
MIERLLKRLHRVFNRSPELTPIVTVIANGPNLTLTLKNMILTLAADGLAPFIIDISTLTVNDLVLAINGGVNGGGQFLIDEDNGLALIDETTGEPLFSESNTAYTAMVSQDNYAMLLARGIMITETGFSYPTNLLYQEFQIYDWTLSDTVIQRQNAEKQLYAHTAEEDWLDYWFSYFAIARLAGETDLAFLTRGIAEMFGPKVNNKALQQIIMKAVGHYVDVKDMGDPSQEVPIPSTIGIFLYKGNINDLAITEKQAIVSIIKRYKASGKAVKYYIPGNLLTVNIADNLLNDQGYVVGPVPGGWTEVSLI